MKDEIITVKIEKIHAEMLDALTPFFGKDRSEVMKNITIKWIEEHIGTDSFKKLEEIGVIKGYRQSAQA